MRVRRCRRAMASTSEVLGAPLTSITTSLGTNSRAPRGGTVSDRVCACAEAWAARVTPNSAAMVRTNQDWRRMGPSFWGTLLASQLVGARSIQVQTVPREFSFVGQAFEFA